MLFEQTDCYRLLVDRIRGRGAGGLILRAGAAGAADCADKLAALDQRDTATCSDNVAEREYVIETDCGVYLSLPQS